MEAFMHSQGFLGTNANLAADTTLIVMIIVGIMFTVGFVLARMGKYEAHRWVPDFCRSHQRDIGSVVDGTAVS